MSSIDTQVLARRNDGKILYNNIDIQKKVQYTDYFISEDLEIIDPKPFTDQEDLIDFGVYIMKLKIKMV